MKTFAIAFTLAALIGQPVLADEFRAGDQVEGTAAFFICGAQEDLATLKVLDRQGDAESARKLGAARCEQGRPGTRYLVMQTAEDALCIRRGTDPYCLWAERASLRLVAPQG